MAKKKTVGAPEGNKNAETWTLSEATTLFNKAIELSSKKTGTTYEYDFIGEIARELGTYHQVFKYLKNKWPKELSELHQHLLSNLESNCFFNIKRGNIREASGIMNLKSNYKWTDRLDNTSGDKPLKPEKTIVKFGK